jgi:hypothetical protein
MSYGGFTLEGLKKQFGLTIQEELEIFSGITLVNPSPFLAETLAENIPLALGIDTEKARSEMIVTPILIELRKLFNRQISLFSGMEFNIDPSQGLMGRCDFLISQSSELFTINAPVLALVEAKNDNLKSWIPQCIAEMIAAQIFNHQRGNQVTAIYGIVTTGSLWKFLRLEGQTVAIELRERFINDIGLILGTLIYIINHTKINST